MDHSAPGPGSPPWLVPPAYDASAASLTAHAEAVGEMLAGRDRAAAAWYRAAMTAERPGGDAFVQADCYDYLPAMQLCVLYDRMGRTREAAQMNELALVAHPGDAAAEETR